MEFCIKGEVAAKKNENRFNRTTGRVFKSDRFRSWHTMAMWELERQTKPRSPVADAVKVSVTFYHGDKRRRDGDNGLSAIMDLLVDARILADDCWTIAREIKVSNVYDKGNPRAIVTIERINE